MIYYQKWKYIGSYTNETGLEQGLCMDCKEKAYINTQKLKLWILVIRTRTKTGICIG